MNLTTQGGVPHSLDLSEPLTDAERAGWLALLHTPRLGPKTVRKLLEQFGSAVAIYEQCNDIDRPGLRQALASRDEAAIERDLDWLAAADDHAFLPLVDPRYPSLLGEIPDAPLGLFVAGNADCLQLPQLGIVGSRNPSAGGLDTAHAFARELADAGLVITSGLALGIDAAAHGGALAANAPTIAVTGNGLDRVYPARHRALAEQIREQGALVSEFAPGTQPLPANFPRRNRIISGLSLGVLVVEAAMRSGSLISARLAAEQGREVFAIPGSIHNPLAKGCHRLLRDGACLVETTTDIVAELASLLGHLAPSVDQPAGDTGMETAAIAPELAPLYAQIGYDPLDIDTLIHRSGLTAEAVSAMLSALEIQGCIAALPGGRVCRS